MRSRESNKAITGASLATLVAALALSTPVLDRLVDAAWQWYKFAGYSGAGHITLSLKTGQLFTALLAVTFGSALWFNRLATRRAASLANRWSFWAMCIAVAAFVAYWMLGMSTLNVWRA